MILAEVRVVIFISIHASFSNFSCYRSLLGQAKRDLLAHHLVHLIHDLVLNLFITAVVITWQKSNYVALLWSTIVMCF